MIPLSPALEKEIASEVIEVVQKSGIINRLWRFVINKIRGVFRMSGNVNITVKNSEGTGLAGAAVSYLVNGETIQGTTNTNGQFTVSDLPAGTYDFAIKLNGYDNGNVELIVADGAMAEGTIALTSTVTAAAAATAAPIQAVSWTPYRTQGEIDVLSTGLQAMMNHESWSQVKTTLFPSLIGLLINYGAALAQSKLTSK